MRPFGRPELLKGLRNFLRIDGDFATPIVEAQQPVLVTGDASRSPYTQYPTPCGRFSNGAGVAAEFRYMGVRPGSGRILELKQLLIPNEQATNVTGFLAILSAANQTTVGVTASQLADLSMPFTAGAEVASQLISGTHTDINAFTQGLFRISILAGDTFKYQWQGPKRPTLWADDPSGIPAIAFINLTANEFTTVCWECDEWPLVASR